MKLPANFASWNPAMRGAYVKGWSAAEAGHPAAACPYKDKRKPNGGLSWSRAFIRAWEDGHADFVNQQDPITQFYRDRANSGQAALAR